jgi:hypothetical protein
MDRQKNILYDMLKNKSSFISEFNFDKNEISVTKKSLSLFMGYTDEIPKPLDDALDVLFKKLHEKYIPSGGVGIFSDIKVEDNGFYCNGVFFHTGRIIAKNLKDAEFLAFFIVTAGIEFDLWSDASFKDDNMLLGYVIDCAGSELAEELAGKVEKKLIRLSNENLPDGGSFFISNRYSPGYCGWDVIEQKKLFSFFPENFCGIKLTDSALMIPVKSVSGVIGLGKKINKAEYQCSICDKEDCIRKRYLSDNA